MACITVEDLCIDLKHQLSEAEEANFSFVDPETGRLIEYHLTRNACIRIGPRGYMVTMPVKKGAVFQIGTTFIVPHGEDAKTAVGPVKCGCLPPVSPRLQRLPMP